MLEPIFELPATEAGQLALDFLLEDFQIPDEDREFFAVLSVKRTGTEWYVAEIGLEGLPDKWAIQVYDTRECDPCYTFVSPMPKTEDDPDLENFPLSIAEMIAVERKGGQL